MKINIINSQKKVKFDIRHLKKTASSTLFLLGEKTKVLSIYVVDDAKIKALNRKYLRHDRPTDVIAFSMSEGKRVKGSEGILGDVVMSAETASKQARQLKRSVKDELDLYLVHGILHLFGYNDLKSRDRKKMETKQEEILQ